MKDANLRATGQKNRRRQRAAGISRRDFLKIAATGAAGTAFLGGCEWGRDEQAGLPATTLPRSEQYPAVPPAPSEPPSPDRLRFFTAQEARTIEALAARIFPGDEDDPGARELGVLIYIDYTLSLADFVEPTYHAPPFAEPFSGEQPPQWGDNEVVWIPEDELERYGFQSSLTPREVYRMGVVALNRYSRQEAGSDFADLGDDEQDVIVEALAEDEATGFEPFSAEGFLQMVLRHTNEGIFADPIYGGNRDLAGWRLIGYPGAQRAYTPDQILQEDFMREPWGLEDLPPAYPGRPDHPDAVVPPRGPRAQPRPEVQHGN
jgi:gluconate 2-dehydrogenase gamma chain